MKNILNLIKALDIGIESKIQVVKGPVEKRIIS